MIYATQKQHGQLRLWLGMYKPQLMEYVKRWEVIKSPLCEPYTKRIWTTTTVQDAWLLVHCPYAWVTDQIKKRYGYGKLERNSKIPCAWWTSGLRMK